ncbi:aldo/keto reductase [Herbiconiux sp. CPCC 205763]|uniref:Aldo/keto reductase n=1 Tax=Herbiconiux aconitum TaxID=2970913 RepID=A0ABT2GQJ3_9MICO|nr:aldo/keto reductase [Herbiconiux aconitum]MCS5718496.1 aldo/keto reductase [Herbiconiux aconitum]
MPEPASAAELPFGAVGYGAANLGNMYRELSDESARAILDAAWESGIRYYDTAPHYGLGLSERRLGEFLRTKPRDQYVVSTKVGRLLRPNPEGAGSFDTENSFLVPADLKRVWDFTPDGVRQSLDESLERLGLDRVDVLFLHDPERGDLQRGLDESLPALASLREQGVVGAVGVGSMSTEALLASARSGFIDLLMVAGRYTLAEQPVFPEVLEACDINGVGIVNASVFNSGLLATNDPGSDSRYEYGGVPAETLARVQAIGTVAREFGVELPAAALQYTARDPRVRSVVVGSSKPDQVRQNVERMHATIPDVFWARLHALGLVGA